MIVLLILPIAYGVTLEWFWRGQTVGKRLLRLRVMDADGLRLQFHQVLMRNLVRFVDMLPGFYLVGGVASLISGKAQRLGDLAASTIVVHHRKLIEPDMEQLLGTKFNSFRAQPHLCARLRQRTSPEEARIALQALIRRDEIDPGARIVLGGGVLAEPRKTKRARRGNSSPGASFERLVRPLRACRRPRACRFQARRRPCPRSRAWCAPARRSGPPARCGCS